MEMKLFCLNKAPVGLCRLKHELLVQDKTNLHSQPLSLKNLFFHSFDKKSTPMDINVSR